MSETPIRLRNSLTRRVEPFVPIDPANVRMYVCGPTVYDRAHLGNARSAVVFDVLFRLLRHVYGEEHVTYVRNITDIDDKIIARAAETGRSVEEITEETTRWYHEDMDALGCLRPTHEPRATEYLPQMIAMISALVGGGHAYEAQGHVLFSVASYEGYGRLSGRSVEDMIAGARVEVAPYKRDPMDFVLWKPSGEGMPGWDSPWGLGRPGWHIECSAMARDLLGGEFDIHGGGLDLQFPHHENEIAQSACVGDSMARVWVHNEMLMVDGRKMSKSLGNFLTVRDLLDQEVPGPVIRLALLAASYGKQLDWTEQRVREAKALYERSRVRRADALPLGDVPTDLTQALASDLNTPLALSILHRLHHAGAERDLAAALDLLGVDAVMTAEEERSQDAFADYLFEPQVMTPDLAEKVRRLMDERDAARQGRDFGRADAIRDALHAAGVAIEDTAAGPKPQYRRDFDPARLEAIE